MRYAVGPTADIRRRGRPAKLALTMAVASTGARAAQGSIIHLLRQREMEMNECKIERLGGRITRSVIVQVSMTSYYAPIHLASPQSSMEFCPVWSKTSKKAVCIGLDRYL